MVLTGNRRLDLDIWLKTPDEVKGTEDMMRIV